MFKLTVNVCSKVFNVHLKITMVLLELLLRGATLDHPQLELHMSVNVSYLEKPKFMNSSHTVVICYYKTELTMVSV